MSATTNGQGPQRSLAQVVGHPTQTSGIARRQTQVAPEASMPNIGIGFSTLQSWELTQRVARAFNNSTLVPVAYQARIRKWNATSRQEEWQDNPSGLSNCIIALNMAERLKADPLMVMQNLHIVEGRPSWSSQFQIAAINACGRFTPLKYRMTVGQEARDVKITVTGWRENPATGRREKHSEEKTISVPDMECVAYATDKATGELLEGPPVTMRMALDEGWVQRAGSKWQTGMRDVMIRYRAASFFQRLYAPDLLMGLPTAEEAVEIIEAERQQDGSWGMAMAEAEANDLAGGAAAVPSAAGQLTHDNAPPALDLGAAGERERVAVDAGADPATGELRGADWPVVLDQQTGKERPATEEEAAEIRAQEQDPAAQAAADAARRHEEEQERQKATPRNGRRGSGNGGGQSLLD